MFVEVLLIVDGHSKQVQGVLDRKREFVVSGPLKP